MKNLISFFLVLNFSPIKCYGQDNQFEKGHFNWLLSFPFANHIITKSDYRNVEMGGFWGISTGLEYFKRDSIYVSVQGGIAATQVEPVPVAIEYDSGKVESLLGLYIDVKKNHIFSRFEYGYGFHASDLIWKQEFFSAPDSVESFKHNIGIGLSAGLQYRILRWLKAGIIYQPNFIIFSDKLRMGYHHLLSFEVICKVYNKKKKR